MHNDKKHILGRNGMPRLQFDKKARINLVILLLIVVLIYLIFLIMHNRQQPLILYGNVDIRDVNLGFRVSGRLMSLKVDEGDTVHPGDLIGHLDPAPYVSQVEAAKAVVNQRKSSLVYAQTVYEREKKLFGTGASSPDRYQNALSNLNSAQANLENGTADLAEATIRVNDTNLYAPSEGVVLTRAVEPGTMLNIGDTVITVTLINPVWVRAYVSEVNLGRAKPGTKVQVFADAFPNKAFEGQIGFVSPTAEFTPKTVETTDLRTDLVYRLRIVMQDPHHELRQGMPVTVKLVEQ